MHNIDASTVSIIQNSILSSIYIDDKIVEPFSERTTENEKYFAVSKGLFDSFRTAKKTIDFYQYNTKNDWESDFDYLFKNRDLIILDWQLNETDGLKQPETLKILKKAVQTDSLHFVSIYTEAKELDEILYSIKAFFNPTFNQEKIDECNAIVAKIDEEGVDATALFAKYKDLFFRIALETEEVKKQTHETLKNAIKGDLGDNYILFASSIRKIDSNITNACEVFGYIINKEPFIENIGFDTDVNITFIADRFIVINHTIIQITNKQDPKPEDLFSFFTNAVQKICGNLLTLISLEVRSLLRESSGFIGKDANLITDEILFHQQNKKESFFDFLMSIIKSHTLSYFDYKQGKLNTVTSAFWDDYGKARNIQQSLDELIKNEDQIIAEIKKLNVYYNTLHITKYSGSKLSFGDIFYTTRDNKRDGRFFLCITAHCDCIEPKENIKNNFFFISGEKTDAHKLINKGDDVFCSYLADDSGIIAINWYSRPVILNIKDSQVNDNKLVALDGLGHEYLLNYHATLKENYTQRMANNSFAHAMRVGIDFAKL
jgi:hypothetical protein